MRLPDLRRRAPREHRLTLNTDAMDARILVPSSLKLEVAHTITRTPPPKPHSIIAVHIDPRGNRYTGTPCFIQGYENTLRIPLPGNLFYAAEAQYGTYRPIAQLECEVWWH
jgi:hypothetical protein